MLLTDDWGTVFYSRKSTCPNQNLIWTPGKEETLCSFIGHQVEQWGFNSIWGPALPTLQFFLYVWWLIKWVYLKKKQPQQRLSVVFNDRVRDLFFWHILITFPWTKSQILQSESAASESAVCLLWKNGHFLLLSTGLNSCTDTHTHPKTIFQKLPFEPWVD